MTAPDRDLACRRFREAEVEAVHRTRTTRKANGAVVAAAPERPPRFTLLPFGAIVPSRSPQYLVREILPLNGLAVVWGPPKCGKSFSVFDLVMHVAAGRVYRGRRVRRGAVV